MEEPRFGMNGNGCAGSMASGVSTGKTWCEEVVLEPGGFGLASARAPRRARCPRAARSSCSSRQRRCWSRGELDDLGADPGELLGGRQAVLGERRRRPERTWPRRPGDADHEELVEVVGRDRQEAQLLQQRMVAVRGLLQHAAVELQPGQLAVDEALRRAAASAAPSSVAAGGASRRRRSSRSTSVSRPPRPGRPVTRRSLPCRSARRGLRTGSVTLSRRFR